MYTVFPQTVFADTINFSCSPYSNTKQRRILFEHMLIAPMEPSSPLFGPHPRLGQQRNWYQSGVGIDKICFFSTYFTFLFFSTFSPILLFSTCTHFAFQPTHFACLSPIFLIHRGTQLSQQIIVCRPNVKFVLF